jgi:hypothetical protein
MSEKPGSERRDNLITVNRRHAYVEHANDDGRDCFLNLNMIQR